MKPIVIALTLYFFLGVSSGHALAPDEILVVANSQMAGSTDLARYYMKKRLIPRDRLLTVSVSTNEVISREEYERAVRNPVRNAVKKLRGAGRVSCLVLFYGMPLKVNSPLADPVQEGRAQGIGLEKKQLKNTSSGVEKDAMYALEQLKAEVMNTNQHAALDSEIALVLVENYPPG